MATPELSEADSVSCPVCFEPYRQPKSLRCGHLLCTPCSQEMLRRSLNNEIECGICREVSNERDLRRDFTMEANVEKYNKGLNEASRLEHKNKDSSTKLLCEICKENDIHCKCIECNQFLCEKCKTLHLRFDVSRYHRMLGLEEAALPFKDKLSATVNQCVDINEKSKCQLKDIAAKKVTLETKTKKALKTIEELSALMIRKIDALTAKVKDGHSQALKSMIQNENILQKSIDNNESVVETISKCLDQNDQSSIIQMAIVHDSPSTPDLLRESSCFAKVIIPQNLKKEIDRLSITFA